MPWPPTIPPADITDSTQQLTRHPADHNAITEALREVVSALGALAGIKILYGRTDTSTATVNFPPGTFTTPPYVIACPTTGADATGGDLTCSVGSVTTTSALIATRIAYGGNAGTPFGFADYIAIGT
jgi:hypothetical protein